MIADIINLIDDILNFCSVTKELFILDMDVIHQHATVLAMQQTSECLICLQHCIYCDQAGMYVLSFQSYQLLTQTLRVKQSIYYLIKFPRRF